MHFPLPEQITFLKSVATLTRGTVVFTQSYDSAYQRFRRFVKRLIGNQPPATYPIDERALTELLTGAGLREVGRLQTAPLISEAIVVIAVPA